MWPRSCPNRRQAESFGAEEFCRRVAERVGARPRTAEWDASAVLSTLADAVSGGELNQILSQLPSGYAALFGRADLSDWPATPPPMAARPSGGKAPRQRKSPAWCGYGHGAGQRLIAWSSGVNP